MITHERFELIDDHCYEAKEAVFPGRRLPPTQFFNFRVSVRVELKIRIPRPRPDKLSILLDCKDEKAQPGLVALALGTAKESESYFRPARPVLMKFLIFERSIGDRASMAPPIIRPKR